MNRRVKVGNEWQAKTFPVVGGQLTKELPPTLLPISLAFGTFMIVLKFSVAVFLLALKHLKYCMGLLIPDLHLRFLRTYWLRIPAATTRTFWIHFYALPL
ncbi:MAG: hypothetical protein WBG50_25570 [Desulfomonilaceae bacterium]